MSDALQRRQQQRIRELQRLGRNLLVISLVEGLVIAVLLILFLSYRCEAPKAEQPTPRNTDTHFVSSSPEDGVTTHLLKAEIAEPKQEQPEQQPEEQAQGELHSGAIPLSFELQDVMQQACESYNVPYSLALAMAERESGFDLDADNGICYGIMQINSINYDRLRGLGIEPTEHEGNIVAGVFMIGELLAKYGDTNKALMAYNCGESGAANLWRQGYSSSQYSRLVISTSEKWQQVIDQTNYGN